MKPEFNSDNDSFLLVLKNLNYTKKTAIKNGDTKSSILENQREQILEFMEYGKEYVLQDFCELLGLKDSRTRVIVKGLVDDGIIEARGSNRSRIYVRDMTKVYSV